MWSYTFQLKHKVDPDLDHWRMFGVFVFVCYRELFLAKTLTLTSSSPGEQRLVLIWQNVKKVHLRPWLELCYKLRLR